MIGDPVFRLLIYEARLRRLPIVQDTHVPGRRISMSPRHFRQNVETERPRITEFVQRELYALLPVSSDNYIAKRNNHVHLIALLSAKRCFLKRKKKCRRKGHILVVKFLS